MSVPIGSIVAFAGFVPDHQFEVDTGWMFCDGRLLDGRDPDFVDLYSVIKNFWGGDRSRPDTFNIPDLRGYFLRGVDGPDLRRDPDADLRRASNPGGPLGRQVGTVQGYATHLPVSPFTISVDGGHQHGLDFEVNADRDVAAEQSNTVAYPWNPGSPTVGTQRAGDHDHRMGGGDLETRPINAYVHWLIRYK